MKLIDADALLEAIKGLNHKEAKYGDWLYTEKLVNTISNAPTVQREGWVSVPIEPTDKMLIAGCEAGLDIKTLMDDTPFSADRATYKAMLQAAPNNKE